MCCSRRRLPSFDFGTNDSRRVSAFGDSITFGVLELRLKGSGLATSSNYPAILQNMLRGVDKAFRVTNRGVPGERTSSGVTRVPGVLAADRPGFLLLMEGTNDASHDDDPSFIVANLETMVIRAQTNKTIPVVGTIPPNFRHDPTAQDIIDSANTLIRRMAQSHHIVVAEIFDGMNDRSLFGQSPDRDPLHPNERGYAVMAGIFGLIMPGIDNHAHLGGFIGGYLASSVMNPLTRERGDHLLMAAGCLAASALAIVYSVLHGLGLL